MPNFTQVGRRRGPCRRMTGQVLMCFAEAREKSRAKMGLDESMQSTSSCLRSLMAWRKT